MGGRGQKRQEEEEEAERQRRAAQPLLKETAFDRRKVGENGLLNCRQRMVCTCLLAHTVHTAAHRLSPHTRQPTPIPTPTRLNTVIAFTHSTIMLFSVCPPPPTSVAAANPLQVAAVYTDDGKRGHHMQVCSPHHTTHHTRAIFFFLDAPKYDSAGCVRPSNAGCCCVQG